MQLTNGSTRIERNSSQGRSQLMGETSRDSVHAQKPIDAFASLQNDSACKA